MPNLVEKFPKEIWDMVFAHLDHESIDNAKATCTLLRGVALRKVWHTIKVRFDTKSWREGGSYQTRITLNEDDGGYEFIDWCDLNKCDLILASVNTLILEFNDGIEPLKSTMFSTICDELGSLGFPSVTSVKIKLVGYPTQTVTPNQTKRIYKPLVKFIQRAIRQTSGRVSIDVHQVPSHVLEYVGSGVSNLKLGLVYDLERLPSSITSLTFVNAGYYTTKQIDGMLGCCENLQVLNIQYGSFSRTVLELSPKLRELELGHSRASVDALRDVPLPAPESIVSMDHFRKLVIDRKSTDVCLDNILCPALDELTIKGNWFGRFQNFIAHCCPNLHTLTLCSDSHVKIGRLASAKPGIDRVHTLVVRPLHRNDFTITELYARTLTAMEDGPFVGFDKIRRFKFIGEDLLSHVAFGVSIKHLITLNKAPLVEEVLFTHPEAHYVKQEKWVDGLLMKELDLTKLKNDPEFILDRTNHTDFPNFNQWERNA